MKISLAWLNSYIDLSDLSTEAIAEALTDVGLEVEDIDDQAAFGPEVVVAEVLQADQHPNADSLRVCQVSTGSGDPMQIVCGAPNARQGIKVALAQVGAVLPGDFKIKKSKIRGEVSFGMMCSETELGLGSDGDGIIELPGDSKLGEPLVQAMGLADTVFELSITPNRADCLGYIGIARDLGAKLGRPLKSIKVAPDRDAQTNTEAKVKLDSGSTQLCQRFCALYVEDVKVVASPGWMQQRLERSGMRPINLVVDVTNYVMLERNQPIHAYDLRDVRGGKLGVRAAEAGEKFTTLDGQERSLEAGDILIIDGQGPVGIAGIMGGLDSEVKDDTTAIVIEAAGFTPTLIRKTSKRLGMHTEASHRFERGTDLQAVGQAALRVGELLQQCVGELNAAGANLPMPKVAGDMLDSYPEPLAPRNIALRLSRAQKILGLPSLTTDQCIDHLTRLEFRHLDQKDGRMLFEAPAWRVDMEREVDLIEEVGRMVGYDRIPMTLPEMNLQPIPQDPMVSFREKLRQTVAATSFIETITLPFMSETEHRHLNLTPEHPLWPQISVTNPISDEYRWLTTTTVTGLLRAVVGNRRRGEQGARLFEIGRGYFNADGDDGFWAKLRRPSRDVRGAALDENRPAERTFLGAIIDSPWLDRNWQYGDAEAAGFYHGKRVLMDWLAALGVQGAQLERVKADELPFLHPGAAAAIVVARTAIGYVGELHPQTAAQWDLDPTAPPVVIEIDCERLYDVQQHRSKYKTILTKFPPVRRDVALLLDRKTHHSDVAKVIKSYKGKHLSGFDLFDVYEGDNVPADKKSLGYSFCFQSDEKTLTDKEVDKEITGLIGWLQEKLDAVQR